MIKSSGSIYLAEPIYHAEPDSGVIIKDGDTLYLGVPWTHHFPVWAYHAGEDVDDWCVIRSNGKMMLAFLSEASRDTFMAWWASYKRRFPEGADMAVVRYPFPPEERITGTIIKSQYAEKEWWWISANIYGNVYLMDGFWFFENDSDAVLFRLRGA